MSFSTSDLKRKFADLASLRRILANTDPRRLSSALAPKSTVTPWIVGLLALSSCASTKELEVAELPFHAVIVPMRDAAVGTVTPGELPGDATGLRLGLTCDEVTRVVGSALEKFCFSRVTVLDHDEYGDLHGAYERDERLVDLARAAGADLLVELDLRYDPEIYHETSSSFWLNFPLFLFAGPTNWFVGDNEYFADVELTTTIYDMNVIEAGALSLGDPAAQVLSGSSRYAGSDLTFTERSDGVGDYALGLIVPSGYLARESDAVAQATHASVLADLREQVVKGIQRHRSDLVGADWIAPLFIDPDDVRITRAGDSVEVEGRVRLLRDGLAARVQVVWFDAGSDRVAVRPGAESALREGAYDVLPFQAFVPVAEGSTTLRLECEAGSRDRFVRSYTFELP